MNDRKKIDAYFEKHRGQMLEDLKTLVRIPSVRSQAEKGKPFGKENAKVLEEALNIAKREGLKVRNFENYVGTIDLGESITQLGILAHLDVMPEGKGWHYPAFDTTLKDGLIFGRGTADDKGPAVAALYAMCAAKTIRPDLKKNARLILGTDEECGSSDIEYYFSHEQAPPNVFSPDSEFPVLNVEKGRLATSFGKKWREEKFISKTTDPEKGVVILKISGGIRNNAVPSEAKAWIRVLDADSVLLSFEDLKGFIGELTKKTGIIFALNHLENEICEITATGVNAHGSTPENGNNALTGLLELLCLLPLLDDEASEAIRTLKEMFPHGDTLGRALGIDCSDEKSGALSMNFGILEMDEKGFRAQFDCRSPISADQKFIIKRVDEHLSRCGAHIIDEAIVPPHVVPEESPFVQTLLRIYHDYTGLKAYCTSTGGGTYVHDIEGGVGFGAAMPGTDNHMHGADEFIKAQDLILSAKMFTQAILDICG